MEELFKKYPWRSLKRLKPIALKHGFKESEINEYFKKNVFHDKLNVKSREYFLPIFGSRPGVYQFDTLIQSKGNNPPAFLVIININSRKAYAYPLKTKGTKDILNALNKFINEVDEKPYQMTSDQDSAYLTDDIIDFMKNNDIDYRTTEDNNHNILGIINRFMKTLRDLNEKRDFTTEDMKRIIKLYNNTEHTTTGKTPNEFNKNDELNYIAEMKAKSDEIKSQEDFNLKPNDKVRVILDNKPLSKKRTNLSKDYYLVDSKDGNGFLIKSKDESVGYYPRHKLIKSSNGKLAETLDDGKRGIIDEIKGYNEKTDKYKVVYTDGTPDTIKAKYMRETRPTHLGPLEIQFWKTQKEIPKKISSFKGLI